MTGRVQSFPSWQPFSPRFVRLGTGPGEVLDTTPTMSSARTRGRAIMRNGFRFFSVLSSLCLCAGVVQLAVARAAEEKPGVVVDKEKRTVTIDAKVAPRKIDDPRYKEIYPIEVIACWAFPKGQKSHETVVTIEAKPSAVHKALVDLGAKPGKPVVGDVKEESQGPEVKIYLDLPEEGGGVKRVP